MNRKAQAELQIQAVGSAAQNTDQQGLRETARVLTVSAVGDRATVFKPYLITKLKQNSSHNSCSTKEFMELSAEVCPKVGGLNKPQAITS